MQSIVERKYPAIPAVPHIMNWELFSPGDSIEWSSPSTMGLADKFLHKIGIKRTRHTRDSFYFSEKVIDEMKEARQCISSVKGFPDVRDWVTPSWPRWSPHNCKYLVKLSGYSEVP